MNHNFLVTAEQREKVVNLILAAGAFAPAIAIYKIEDFSMVTTENEQLATILDQALPGKEIAIDLPISGQPAPKPKKSEKKTVTPRLNGQQKIAHCRRCKVEYQPKGFEKLCPECAGAPKPTKGQPSPWKIVRTGEHLAQADLSAMLHERSIQVGTGLVHAQRGTYEVIDNGRKLTLERIME